MSKKGAKFIDRFIHVFMANKNFPINEQVNDYIIFRLGCLTAHWTKQWVLKGFYNPLNVSIMKISK